MKPIRKRRDKRANFHHPDDIRSGWIALRTALKLKDDWNVIKSHGKQEWATLATADLEFAKGKRHELPDRIPPPPGETGEAVEQAIKESYSCRCK